MSGLITGGGSSSSGRQDSSSSYDPYSLEVNKMRAGQLQGLIGSTGGAPALSARGAQLALPNTAEQGYLSTLQGRVNEPLVNPYEAAGLETLRGLSNPEPQIAASRDYLERIAGPSIMNSLISSGMGRSGAQAEAFGNAGAQLALPILQQAQQAGTLYGQTQLGLGGLTEQRTLDRLMAALDAAGAGRRAQYEGEVQNPLNILMQLLTGLPTLAATSQSTGRQSGSSWNFGLCWIADAIYGVDSPEASLARYWISFGWQGPVATIARCGYAMVGRPVAALAKRSSCVRRWLRPVFDIAVRRAQTALAVA